MSENGKIYTAGKNFTLPPAVTGVTNSTSDQHDHNRHYYHSAPLAACCLVPNCPSILASIGNLI